MAELMRLTVETYPAPSDLEMLQELIALIDLTQQSYLQAARSISLINNIIMPRAWSIRRPWMRGPAPYC